MKTIAPIPTGICSFLVVAALALSAAAAEETNKKRKGDVVREITLKSPGGEYKGATKPTRITSLEELTKVLPDEDLIPKQVDFTREQCLFFAWQGSQGDKLSFKVEQGRKGPVVVFSYSVGLPEDLRPHYHLYAIPRNATWRVEDRK